MGKTSIEWTDENWNPTRGCSRISPGCGGARGVGGCYAERQAARFCGPGQPYEGLVRIGTQGPRWTGVIRLVHEKLREPLSWRTPRRVFVDSMSDLFHEALSDDDIDHVFAVMLICCLHETRGGHTFQILTKRARRMWKYMTSGRAAAIARIAGSMMEDGDRWHDCVYEHVRKHGLAHPLIWMGVSVENRECAAERIYELRGVPAGVRFLSCEPLLEDLGEDFIDELAAAVTVVETNAVVPERLPGDPAIHWVIVGGESGPGARPFNPSWAKNIIAQCRRAGVACFVKQLGANVLDFAGSVKDRKGGDMAEWPPELRVREFPEVRP